MATGQLFSRTTQALFYNYKQLPVQRMLDFDFLCRRETPSVAGIINPGSEGFHKLFFGQEEIAIPVHSTVEAACTAHPTADVFINFASSRSAFASSMSALKQPTIRVVVIIAECVPESDTKQLISYAKTNNKVKMIVVLGEVGGRDEYSLLEALKQGKINKPVVASVKSEVQLGHASGGEIETAQAKNQALKDAGAVVATSYEDFEGAVEETFQKLVKEGKTTPVEEVTLPQIPEDLNTAIKNGKVRVPTHIISTISDERGVEQQYAGVPMSILVEQGYGVGNVVSLLWFKRSLPRYCSRFIETCIMMCADHGPCASGAHNSIVTARAGKDLISCLVSGLLTIDPRFGGAIDDAARYFKDAHDRGLTPSEFVEGMKKKGIRVPGIGHRVKRGDNRDKRVELLQRYARENFSSVEYMEYAVQV